MSDESFNNQTQFQLNIVNQCIFLSETYTIEDCSFYDPSSSSTNLSKYRIPNNIMTYDSTNNAYQLNSNGVQTVIVNNLTVPNMVKIECEIMITQDGNVQPRIGLFNGNDGITCRYADTGAGGQYHGVMSHTKTTDGNALAQSQNLNLSRPVWYSMENTFNNGSVTTVLKQNNSTLSSITATETVLSSSSNDVGICGGYGSGDTFLIKNIKIKSL